MLADHVLFLDGEAIILDKPSGLPVDPPRDGTLSVHNHLASLTFGFKRWPEPVHRLDRDTSGCLLLARNPKAAARFGQAFEQRQVIKRYLAVLAGVPAAESGTITLPLAKISRPDTGWRMAPDAAGKAAVSAWRLLGVAGDRALVEFSPETGRTHQLRSHALHGLGIPIAGDPVYGDGIGPMLLHAAFLSLARGEKPPAEAAAPLPAAFIAAGFGDIARDHGYA